MNTATGAPAGGEPREHFHQPSLLAQTPLRRAITAHWCTPEPELVPGIVQRARLTSEMAPRVRELALRLARTLRDGAGTGGRGGLVQELLQEYALSSQEGVALMCLAEALLRIPDAATRDALIRDRIVHGEWRVHLGRGRSLFVNAAIWGLLLTGKMMATHSDGTLSGALSRIVGRGGEPLVRRGVDMVMRMMGEQFVTGQTIGDALQRARAREAQGFRYSYDMLGEAAMTARDAARYRHDYQLAIDAIGWAAGGRGPLQGPGISIKLSALHPRYSRAQYQRVLDELYPSLLQLCRQARHYSIGINIDAEEASRLELSLDLLEKLALEPRLQRWDGLGFVVQSYQKRSPWVIDWLIELARRSGHRLMVRLVKGAYWDTEIKRAQVQGLSGYPVYTRKPYTDAAYIDCARKLLAATDAVYPQFATHNARTLAAVYELAGPASWEPGQYEFQCLHGMGEPLYEQVVGAQRLDRPCRIYAPVGTHETLLTYLVRRLLENGANSSFVNQIGNLRLALDELVRDPVEIIEAWARSEGTLGLPHPAIPLPGELYGAGRRNSRGLNLDDEAELQRLADAFETFASDWQAAPLLAVVAIGSAPRAVRNPALASRQVGTVCNASRDDVQAALAAAQAHAADWAAVPSAERARLLRATADRLEADMPRFMALAMREAGKSAANAMAEVREAVDFLRYYASQAETFERATHQPLGPVVCISPWNFPLAIFTGQVSAALAAGNVVLAKPAEQTPLIAETGGQNAMIVDSSALPEQVVADALESAFDSAGQRCSALRVLCVQEDVAAPVLDMLLGAMDNLLVGNPTQLATDVGPVIDAEAQERINRHIDEMRRRGHRVHQIALAPGAEQGTFVAPTLIEIDHVSELTHEVFGPVLHYTRYHQGELDGLMSQINGTGYGLTMGVHTRIEETLERIVERAQAGNLYVNRNIVGAVVGVQPFGGQGLSGTGPKAGGPLYLGRLLARQPADVLRRALPARRTSDDVRTPPPALWALRKWATHAGNERLAAVCTALVQRLPASLRAVLSGPTGEQNVYTCVPRSPILCLATAEADLLTQLAAVLALGSRAMLLPSAQALVECLPPALADEITVVANPYAATAEFDAVLLHGSIEELASVQQRLLERPGKIIGVERLAPGSTQVPLERLVREHVLCTNTTAAGGNAALMTL